MNAKSILRFVALLMLSMAQADGWAQTANADAIHPSGAGARGDSAWFSYRDIYQSMIRFEKYGKPKQFIENHLQVLQKEANASNTSNSTHVELRLALEGKAIHLTLPLDPLGRTVFPLLKAAYDDNAELTINRPAGTVTLTQRVSIVPRADGVYDAADLRAACGQVWQFLEYANFGAASNKHCAGVQFIYARDNEAISVSFKNAEQKQSPLQWSEGKAFADDAKGETGGTYRIVTYRFAAWPDKGQIVTNSAPLAVAALLE
jgi:hypothetical protein